jgi:hypothetical protein
MIGMMIGVMIVEITIAIIQEEITIITGSDLQGSQNYLLLSS